MKWEYVVFWLFGVLFWACGTEPAPATDAQMVFSDTDRSAILDVIRNESDAFYARDFEGWKSHYAEDPVTWTCVEENQVVLEAYTRRALEHLVGDYLAANPAPDEVAIRRENARIIPAGDGAWVHFDEYQTKDGRTKVLKGARFMVRQNGQWKIAGMQSAFVRYTEAE